MSKSPNNSKAKDVELACAAMSSELFTVETVIGDTSTNKRNIPNLRLIEMGNFFQYFSSNFFFEHFFYERNKFYQFFSHHTNL